MEEILAFDRWSAKEVVVADPGLKDYISLTPKLVPKTGARYAGNRFHKSKVFIVERLVNKLMVAGHKSKKHFKSSGTCTGKSQTNLKIVEKTFEVLEEKTGQNPISVFVKALENAAPREEVIAIEYGGARYPKAVECAPQRRIDIALRHFTQGAYHKAHNSRKAMVDCLATELLNAFNEKTESVAISKKLENERQADASR